jgi:glycosyltransferase involved in cell wall biosynthesis
MVTNIVLLLIFGRLNYYIWVRHQISLRLKTKPKVAFRGFRGRLFYRLRPKLKNLAKSFNVSPQLRFYALRFLHKVFLGKEIFLSSTSRDNPLVYSKFQGWDSFDRGTLIDAQCLRSSTFFRGIGRYTFALSVALAESNPNHQYVLMFSNIGESENIPKIILKLKDLGLPNLSVCVVDVFKGEKNVSLLQAQTRFNDYLLELKPQLILVPSIFEHPVDCLPINLNSECKVIGLVHDVIPLAFPNELLPHKDARKSYLEKVSTIKDFDGVVTVSQFTADELVRLKISHNLLGVIGGAGFFKLDESTHEPISTKYGVLCVGAETIHKNLHRLIEAYSLLSHEIRERHPLYIVGVSNRSYERDLRSKYPFRQSDLVFLRNISDEELGSQYKKSRLVVVPSLIEGLSMPAIEAWQNGTVAVGGKGTVLEEVLGDFDLLFDPKSAASIAHKIEQFLTDDKKWTDEKTRITYKRKLFNWSEVARKFSSSAAMLNS